MLLIIEIILFFDLYDNICESSKLKNKAKFSVTKITDDRINKCLNDLIMGQESSVTVLATITYKSYKLYFLSLLSLFLVYSETNIYIWPNSMLRIISLNSSVQIFQKIILFKH